MKKTEPYYADLNEFWVIGDFATKVFMGWGGEYHQCYIDYVDPSEAEKFSTYKEALQYMKSDEDTSEWVEEHGGRRFAGPLRCRKSVVVYPPGRRST